MPKIKAIGSNGSGQRVETLFIGALKKEKKKKEKEKDIAIGLMVYFGEIKKV